ncbi:hypothetical protein BDN72DRAFT_247372 [Pluteus cervinus]|uniref:Uncharacterized protein n=1 Tax=Pluteus cervinus TaxID=181527 RepID=A0ACD3B5G4_9AGAR|nr:hypothetical protein BDN72DRAFT_247372 [Pluteus cervinus]
MYRFPIDSSQSRDVNLLLSQSPAPGEVPPDYELEERSQVHNVFKTEGILQKIFDHLSPPVHSSSDVISAEEKYKAPVEKATLLSAALTCHTFHEPALDALWRTLDSFYPLSALVPCSGEGYRRMDGDLIRLDIPSVLGRYQNRVQTLIWSTNKDECSSRYFMVTALGPDILPNLRTLIIPHISDGLETHILYAIGSSLIQTIDIAGPSYDVKTADFNTLLTTLCYRSRNSLQTLRLPYSTLPPTVFSLPFLNSVRFTLDQACVSTLQGLSACSSLRTMHLIFEHVLLVCPPFPSIEKAHVGGRIAAIDTFLKNCRSTNVRSLSLRIGPPRLPDQPVKPFAFGMFRTLKEKWGTTLTSLRVTGSGDDPSDFASCFEELGNLPLVFLSIDFARGQVLPASLSLTTIASNFPNIQYLHLPPYADDGGATLAELHELAKLHPALRELTASLNTERTSSSADSPILQHRLNILRIYDNPISDPCYVAEQLYRSFPYLETDPEHCRNSTYAKKWREVDRILQFARRAPFIHY